MKITKDRLKSIIQEELAEILDAKGSPSYVGDDSAGLLRDMRKAIGALQAAGPAAVTSSNLETIQSLLDRLKASVSASEVPGESTYRMVKDPTTGDRSMVRKSDYLADPEKYGGPPPLEEGKCPPGHYWKSFGGQGGTCIKDPNYKGPKSAYSQGGTVSPPRGAHTPKYEE